MRVVRSSTGQVRRLSAAVVVNHRIGKDDRGNAISEALTVEQIEKMTALVRETIGFNKERGDSVNLMNAPFAVEKRDEMVLPLWRQPEMQDLARSLAWPIGTVLLVALVLLGLVRPGLKAMAQRSTMVESVGEGQVAGQLDAAGGRRSRASAAADQGCTQTAAGADGGRIAPRRRAQAGTGESGGSGQHRQGVDRQRGAGLSPVW